MKLDFTELTLEEKFFCFWADNGIIHSQQLCKWCAYAPELEIEMSLANIALDFLGQARLWLDALVKKLQLRNINTNEDEIIYLREANQFYNLTLLEQPNGDYAMTIAKMFLYDVYYRLILEHLAKQVGGKNTFIKAIAEKSKLEVDYHVKFSTYWTKVMIKGSSESKKRFIFALRYLLMYCAEFFIPTSFEEAIVKKEFYVNELKTNWLIEVTSVLSPIKDKLKEELDGLESPYLLQGKQNFHSEHLSYLLSEMQSLSQKHPGVVW